MLYDRKTKSCQHKSMLRAALVIFILIFQTLAFAYHATVSIYTFEHKGSNSSKKIELEDRSTPLPVEASWFGWSCAALKQVDGVKISCERGADLVETKLYCFVQNKKEARYLKVNNGDNFVSFEAKCSLTLDEKYRIARSKTKKKKKAKAPESELIPVPVAPPTEPAPQELQVEPPAPPAPAPPPGN